MLSALFLNIDASDILLVILFLLLHLVSFIFFINSFINPSRLMNVSLGLLALQFVMNLIVLVSFFNVFSLLALVVTGVMMLLLFRKKKKQNKSTL
jgi:hypothetical protein